MTEPLPIAFTYFPHGKGLPLPAQQSAGAAGADLRAAITEGEEMEVLPGGRALVPCGFAMALPAGFEGQIRPRSGLAAHYGVTVLNAPGTIDADYRGEVKVLLVNLGEENFVIRRGDRIAQLVVAPVTAFTFQAVDTLDETARGQNGFGSTGHRE
jgi:dUTP pyrophosphatase